MQTYNVYEIAKLLNTDKETVRRWIRSGKLNSTISSKKGGHVVREEDLFAFAQTIPKYRNMLNLPSPDIEDAYLTNLRYLLMSLIIERERLNERISNIQNLLNEEI